MKFMHGVRSVNGTMSLQSSREDTQIGMQPSNVADGCLHVYVDAGTNRGVQIRKLFEPDKYPKAPFTSFFQKSFGNESEIRKNVCVFGFEPDPTFTESLSMLESCYKSKGWRTEIYTETGVGPENTQTTFYVDNTPLHLGSSFIARHGRTARKVMVPIIDFKEFLTMLSERKLPSRDGSIEPRMLMKVDVEATEYSIMHALVNSGLICMFDEVYVEWHTQFFSKQIFLKQNSSLFSPFSNPSVAQNYAESYEKETKTNATQKCGRQVLADLDDETYGKDRDKRLPCLSGQ